MCNCQHVFSLIHEIFLWRGSRWGLWLKCILQIDLGIIITGNYGCSHSYPMLPKTNRMCLVQYKHLTRVHWWSDLCCWEFLAQFEKLRVELQTIGLPWCPCDILCMYPRKQSLNCHLSDSLVGCFVILLEHKRMGDLLVTASRPSLLGVLGRMRFSTLPHSGYSYRM